MTESNILYEINQLPDNLQQEVMHFIIFLKKEYLHSNNENKSDKRVFGRAKGKYKLAPDFDETLDDFREYIQ
jgi:hypothetical protein